MKVAETLLRCFEVQREGQARDKYELAKIEIVSEFQRNDEGRLDDNKAIELTEEGE